MIHAAQNPAATSHHRSKCPGDERLAHKPAATARAIVTAGARLDFVGEELGVVATTNGSGHNARNGSRGLRIATVMRPRQEYRRLAT
jgi:hypothetical protein